jgi:hypothetical protein
MSKTVVEFVIVAVIFALVLSFSVVASFNDTEYVVTVTDKERVVKDNVSKYIIFTEDEQGNVLVFENTDDLWRGKFDSSNMQGQLKEGNKYTVTVVGYRVPFLSMYQNIIKIESEE